MTFRKVNFSVMQQGDGNQPHPAGTLLINQDNVLVMHDGTTYGGNVIGAHPFDQTLNTYDNATFSTVYANSELHLNPGVPLVLTDSSGLAGRLDFNAAVELSSRGDLKLIAQSDKIWKFGTDGGLTLANGGYVSGENGLSASSTATSTGAGSWGGPNAAFNQSSFTSGSLSSIAPGWIAVDANGLILTILQANAYGIPGMLVADGNWSTIGPYTFYSSDYVSLSNPVSVKGGLGFENGTTQTTAYQMVSVPTHSTGTSGDKAGMVAVDGTNFYYCLHDYGTSPSETFTVTNVGENTNAIKVNKAANPHYNVPQAGWTTVVNGVTMTLSAFSASDNNGTDFDLLFVNGSGPLPSTVTLTSNTPYTDIWAKVAWTGTTW